MSYIVCKGCGCRLNVGCKLCPHCGKLVELSAVRRRNTPPQGGNRVPPKPRATAGTNSARQPRPRAAANADPARRTAPQVRANADHTRRTAAPRAAVAQRPARPTGNVRQVQRPDDVGAARRRQFSAEIRRNENLPDEKSKRARPRRTADRKFKIAARLAAAAVCIAVIGVGGHFLQVTRVRLSDYPFTSEMKMTYSSYGKAMDNYFEDGSWSVNLLSGKCTYSGTSRHGEEYEMIFTVRTGVKLTSLTIDGEKVDGDRIEAHIMGMFI